MKSKRPTITDVAQQAGVSKSTVSAVLNDSGAVKTSTRDRVLAVMEELNYRPSGRAGRIGVRKGGCIGLLIKETDNPYYAEIAAGVRKHADKMGATVLVTSSEGEYDAERRAVEVLQAKDVDGLIITPVLDDQTDLSHLFELKRRNFPFVLLEEIRGVQANLVDIDNVEASCRAVSYLIEQGHTQIVHFAGPAYSTHSQERIDGVRRAYSESSLIFNDEVVTEAGAHLADGYRAGLAYFGERSASDRPTAATCYNDLVALGVLRALRELGMRVPEDVSLVGCDDIPLLDYLPLPLTSIRVPKFEMGEVAARMLLRQIESPESIPPQKVYLQAELILRESTRSLLEDEARVPAAAVSGMAADHPSRAPP
jgi:LacI family transcriptional regulator/LacI family repressor for deo operon, udp, cdd, tsx, nupC, and nupG